VNRFKYKLAYYVESLAGLFYPRICPACKDLLNVHERVLCVRCINEFPYTNFHFDAENEVAKLFWGRIKIENATSFFYFKKGSRYQHIIHEIKYHNQKHLGKAMGKWFGYELQNTPFSYVDIIVPVPLHYSKMKKRGYNQSELIAHGLSEAMNIPVECKALKRTVNTDTQTRKSKYERWINVEGIFQVVSPDKLKGKHILLVDDVVTTGSTLEACASAILTLDNTRVSVLTLACARLQ
jgi:ComF family protein